MKGNGERDRSRECEQGEESGNEENKDKQRNKRKYWIGESNRKMRREA